MMKEIQAVSFTPQPQDGGEDNEDLLTLSQRFQRKFKTKPSHLSRNLNMRLGIKDRLTKLTGSKKSTGTMSDSYLMPHTAPMESHVTSSIQNNRCKRKMTEKRKFNSVSEGQTSAVMERAAKVQSSLDPKFPSFFKLMLRSHATQGFWLGLPLSFCRLHLPNYDTTIILEGEDGSVYHTNYISERNGLSGGWRRFALAHTLHEGDIVVFHLVLPCRFKVYIERANRLPEVDETLALVHFDDSTSDTNIACNEKTMRRCEHTDESHQMPLFPDIHQEMPEVNDQMAVISYLAPEEDECANSGVVATSVSSEDMDISELSNMSNPFVDIQDFKIIVNGSIIDSELSKDLQARYHELCCSRNKYLHEHLKGISQKLVAGIIAETMDIADGIRASNHSTCLDDYKDWDKTLEALEMLGMNVGFLRARLNRLMGLVIGSTEEVDSKRYEEASCKRGEVEEEIRNLELKLLELKKTNHGLEKEMESVKEKTTRYKMMFQEEASAAW